MICVVWKRFFRLRFRPPRFEREVGCGWHGFLGVWVLGVYLVDRNRPRSWEFMWEGAGFWGLLVFMREDVMLRGK